MTLCDTFFGKISIFLVCNHVTRRPCWVSIPSNFFSKNIHMKMEFSLLTRGEKCFVLDHQHGCRDVTCKLAILVSPLDSMMHCLQYYCSFISLECKTIAPS